MFKYTWKKTWTFWPRWCRFTGKRITMCSQVYRGTRVISGPGTDVIITKWASPKGMMFAKLRDLVG